MFSPHKSSTRYYYYSFPFVSSLSQQNALLVALRRRTYGKDQHTLLNPHVHRFHIYLRFLENFGELAADAAVLNTSAFTHMHQHAEHTLLDG